MFNERQNKENWKYRINGQVNQQSSSSIFDDKRQTDDDIVIIIDDEEEIPSTTVPKAKDKTILKNLISKLDADTELILVQPTASARIYTSALPYPNLSDTHIILVNHSLTSSPECLIKRQLYLSKADPFLSLPVRTRVYHHSLSLLGFIIEKPTVTENSNRYLILYDNYTADYHSPTDFHICLCQDFHKHLSSIDYPDLRSYYQHAFQDSHRSTWPIGRSIRVRKFGPQYHNARIIAKDCSIIKICFFERKTQPECWIHSNSSMIEPLEHISLANQLIISSSSQSETDFSYLRKRKSHVNHLSEGNILGRKKLRDRSNTKQIELTQRQSSSSSDEILSASRTTIFTTYYTDILLPKFQLLNNLPYIPHKCNPQCVFSAEENLQFNPISVNPFLFPFECKWSIIDGRPRGYRTPCHRTFYSLDDIDKYLYRTESKLSIKFFVDDLLTRFTPAMNTFEEKYFRMKDLSRGLENVLIAVYNDLNDEQPDDFNYITRIQPFDHRIAAAFNDTNMSSCCDCTDNCNDRMKCACFRKTLDQALLNHDPLVIEKQKNRYSLAYIIKAIGYQRKRLLNFVSSGIYECNSKCSCHRHHCSNRLVQHGPFVQLQLFKDKHKGWGLRTLHDLPRGTFICQYIGELITSDQGHERAQTMDDRYQTSLDLVKQIRYDIHHDDEEDDDDDDDDEPYVIDGGSFGNLGKYFNHSCEPNMYIQNVFIESHDLHFPNLALFTHTRVKAGEELTWHYNCELLPDREVKCYCGSKNCRGRLL